MGRVLSGGQTEQRGALSPTPYNFVHEAYRIGLGGLGEQIEGAFNATLRSKGNPSILNRAKNAIVAMAYNNGPAINLARLPDDHVLVYGHRDIMPNELATFNPDEYRAMLALAYMKGGQLSWQDALVASAENYEHEMEHFRVGMGMRNREFDLQLFLSFVKTPARYGGYEIGCQPWIRPVGRITVGQLRTIGMAPTNLSPGDRSMLGLD